MPDLRYMLNPVLNYSDKVFIGDVFFPVSQFGEQDIGFFQIGFFEVEAEFPEAVIKGMDEGMSSQETGALVRDVWTDLETWEAERIARTEAARARAIAGKQAYGDAGIQKVVWIVGPNPCSAICAPRAGKAYPIDEFPDQPAHPSCMCSQVAAVDDLERLRREALAGTGPITAWPTVPAPTYRQ